MVEKRELNLSKTRVEIPVLDPVVRRSNFKEIIGEFSSLEDAQLEARRCLRCPNKPCQIACPINNRIPEFLEQIENGNLEKAFEIIRTRSSLPGVCSRVCSQEVQCEGNCNRGKNGESVNISGLERFVSNWAEKNIQPVNESNPKKLKVAVIGSGPAGLAAADVLIANADVTVFESSAKIGGVLSWGIPEIRLPNIVLENIVKDLKTRGVNFEVNSQVDSEMFNEIRNRFDKVILTIGADFAKSSSLLNETEALNADGVFQAKQLLELINESEEKDLEFFKGKRVIVIGGGNVAMDVAAVSSRVGAKEVKVVYRRSIEELPARQEEVEFNKEEGVEFKLLTSPVEFVLEENIVKGIICQKVELGELDENGRRSPVCVIGSEFIIEADVVVLAIGTESNSELLKSFGLELEMNGLVKVDEFGKTNLEGVFAAGDLVTGPATVVLAQKTGREVAFNVML